MIDDPVIREMMALDAIAPFEDLAPLWDWRDPLLQAEVDKALRKLALDDDVRRNRLAQRRHVDAPLAQRRVGKGDQQARRRVRDGRPLPAAGTGSLHGQSISRDIFSGGPAGMAVPSK